jgi:hypothetical protein
MKGLSKMPSRFSFSAASVNKEFELFYLEKFKENLQNFPQGDICTDECPDFLVKNPNGIIGIELTHFYRQMPVGHLPLQQRESVRRKIINEAKSIYDESGFAPVHVHVHFGFNFCCRASEIKPVAERLAQLVGCSTQAHVQTAVLRRDEIQLLGIDLLHIEKHIKPKSYWSAPQASFVPNLQPDQLQGILDAKSRRCQNYRTKCDQAWLVIAMDRFRPSSFALIKEHCHYAKPRNQNVGSAHYIIANDPEPFSHRIGV